MSFEIGAVLALASLTVTLLVSERLPVDTVALLVMLSLMVLGILEPAEGIAGFANIATVTVGAMFVLGAGLVRTGAVASLGPWLERAAQKSMLLMQVVMMLSVALLSAFLNNTAVVAILIPVLVSVAQKSGRSPSKLLMPLSFASMLGGTCTLIGTSTNILGSSIAERHGLEAFSLFEFSSLGVVTLAAGSAYMLLVGIRLIPDRRGKGDLTRRFEMKDFLTEIVLLDEARSVGQKLGESRLLADLDMEVLHIVRGGNSIFLPSPDLELKAGDRLKLRCSAADIAKLKGRDGIEFAATEWTDSRVESADSRLVEAVVGTGSSFVGRTIRELRFRETFGAAILAIRHRGEVIRGNTAQVRVRAGDSLLLDIRSDQVANLSDRGSLFLVSGSALPALRPERRRWAVGIAACVVGAVAVGALPVVVAAVGGALAMVLFRCLTPEEAYAAVDWRVLFLLTGMLSLGAAMEKTGAAHLVAGNLVAVAGFLGPVAILSVIYLMTSLLTEAMSNNAAVALITPISIVTAESAGLDPRPFVVAVMFAASSSFMTPVGYQTNTMIFGPGHYRFYDFFRVGAPLNILLWVIATLLIPVFWPLR
jgi:di/tricarboxylate transporter